MDTNSPYQDDLRDIEHLLSGWRPDTEGLSREAMLFAAGVATGRVERGRLLWPSLCTVLAVSVVVLGVWGINERTDRQLLISRLHEYTPPLSSTSPNALVAAPHLPSATSTDSYLNLRRQFERDPGKWLALRDSSGPACSGLLRPNRRSSGLPRLKPCSTDDSRLTNSCSPSTRSNPCSDCAYTPCSSLRS